MEKLVIDTETTGLSCYANKVLTVGLLLVDVEKDFLEILDESHICVRHENYRVDPAAFEVHKIDLEKHDKVGVPVKDACLQINDFVLKNEVLKTPVLGHNVSFDRGFLNSLFMQGKVEPKISNVSVDTMHLWNSLKKRGVVPFNLRSNLGTVANFFGVDYGGAHDALEDCKITAEVYRGILGLEK